MDLVFKHLGKQEIGEIIDEIVRKHIGSPHWGSSHYGDSLQSDELTKGLHDNIGKMNLVSN